MEERPNLESKINETLNNAKSIKSVEVPAFFTEKTVSKLRASIKEESSFSYSGILKIAAMAVLLIANAYTINYILNQKQEPAANMVTVKDLVNDYQTADATELTVEENLNR